MKRFFLSIFTVAIASSFAMAQMPEEHVVVGASTGWFPGAHLGYTIADKMQIGAQLGFRSKGKADNEVGTNAQNSFVTICLYGKYFLSKGSDFNTYGLGMLYINPASQDGINVGGANEGFLLGAGAEYFPSKTVGLFAQIAVVRFPFSSTNDALNFGIMAPSIGMEWFLDLD